MDTDNKVSGQATAGNGRRDGNDAGRGSSRGPIYSLEQIASWTSGESEVSIPAIQRGLVWKPNQVELLWDSILRRFPVGSFLLSDVTESGKGKYYLMDGQQRYNAISIGFNKVPDARAVLWIDIDPPEVTDSTRVFWVKATTIPHPWGFKNDDACSRLKTREKREALDRFGLGDGIYNKSIPLKKTWPVESRCPLPLYCLIEAAKQTDDAGRFFDLAYNLFQESDFAYREKIGNAITDRSKAYVRDELFGAFSALKDYRVSCNYLPEEVIEKETAADTNQQTTLEVLFTRLNTGGTQISRDDLNYAAIKAYWPSIKETNDRIAGKYMNPAKLVMLAFRLALTGENDTGFRPEMSVQQIRGYAGDEEIRERIEQLYKEDTPEKTCKLEMILRRVDECLGVSGTGGLKTPAVLRTLISSSSPDVYLLLMYIALKETDSRASVGLTPEETRSLAFGLHWFSSDKRGCVQEIFKRCRDGINIRNIRMGVANMIHDNKIQPVYSPEEIFSEVKGNQNWKAEDDIPRPGRDFFRRIFRYGNRQSAAAEMLLYAEREYINTHFANYDPACQDLWEDYNRPWDFDHIVSQDRIRGKRGPYLGYNKEWLDSIGNMAAISYEANRSKNAGAEFGEYEKNEGPLLFNPEIKEIQDRFNDSAKESVKFARITYERFLRIYTGIYGMLKPVFGVTELSETLQKRKNLMMEIKEHYAGKGRDAMVHFCFYDDDYPLDREQDWAREWIGVGIKDDPYMVCFEWNVREVENGNSQNVEVGIRKFPGSKVSDENMGRLVSDDNPSENPFSNWWYMCENPSPEEIDENHLIERMNHYLSIIPQARK